MDFYSIASGSSGNCTFIGSGGSCLLVDAGITAKRITGALGDIGRNPAELQAILLTHEHSDHIQGLGVMSRKYHIPIYATGGTLRGLIGNKSLGSIDPALFHTIRADETFEIGNIRVRPFEIPHDAAEPVGFRLEDGSACAAVATDMGCYDDYIVQNLQGLDLILLESNHDVNMLQVGPYPYPLKRRILGDRGHLSNDTAGHLLCEILHDGMKEIILGHLSKENNYDALAYASVCAQINMSETPWHAEDFDILVARRDRPLPVLTV